MLWPTDVLSLETWILLGTLSFLSWYYFHTKWQYLKQLNIQHDSPSILKFGTSAQMFVKPFAVDLKYKEKYGPVWGFYFFTTPCIMVHDLDMQRQIYVKEFTNFAVRQDRLTKMFGKELGAGITVVKGDQWRRIRSAMTPTFSSAKLKKMIPIMDWCTENTVESLNRKVQQKSGVFSAKDLFSRVALDIVCSAAFSTKVQSQDDTQEDPQIVVQSKKLFSTPFFSPLMYISFLFPSTENFFVKLGFSLLPKSCGEFFVNLANFIIDKRKSGEYDKNCVDLLTLMLESEISEEAVKAEEVKGMTKLEIIGNSMLMILAGYENTGNQMTFLAYNLATHPEIQQEVQREIDDMMDDSETFEYEKVNSLKKLDQCLNESMRLYTPLLRNSRICTNETTINGIRFPKGVSVAFPVYALAHDEEYWDEPFKFKPERMENMNEIDPFVYQPFGAGPRNCIGMRFAILEIKMTICKILRHFTLEPTNGTPEPPLELVFAGASVRSKVDFNLRAVPRAEFEA